MATAPNPLPRYKVNMFMRSPSGEVQFACSRNLSFSGVFLETAARPPVGSEHSLAFVWGDDAFECLVRVVRHDLDGIGVAFLSLEEPTRIALSEIISESPRSRPK